MHIPIFAKETEEIVKKNNFKSICDCTFGTGGHTKIFLQYCNNVTAFDRDINVRKYTENLGNLNFINDKFSNISNYIEQCDLIFADLGMSTLQLESDRGFAYLKNTELDMRMSEDYSQLKLKNILNKMPMYKIKEIIKNYGEEKHATKIASNIEKYRFIDKCT